MALWVLYIMSIGWRYARQTASQATLYLTSLVIVYSLLAMLINIWFSALFPAWVRGSGLDLPSSDVAFYTQRSLTFMTVPLDVLIVLLCSALAVFVVAHGVRYMRRLIASRALPSMSFRGFIFKGLLLVWLSLSFLFSLNRSEIYLANTTFISKELFTPGRFGYLAGICLFLLFLLLAFVGMLLLILSASRYILRLIKEARRNKALLSPSAALAGWGRSAGQRIRALAPTLLYSVVLFLMFYVVALVAMNVLYSFVLPLIDNTSEGIKSESWLDECFVPLVILGAFISLAIMYRKGWRGLGRGEYDLFSQGGWLSFSKDLLRSIGSRSLRSGLFWSLGVAYVVALASAFLLAELHPPPLPKVEVSKVPQTQSVRSGEQSAFQGKRLALLAHTEGYWYLIDEDENHLLVVPDQDDQFIRLRLDEQP
jgi:hypothetical protein